jgi:hypothetical protein
VNLIFGGNLRGYCLQSKIVHKLNSNLVRIFMINSEEKKVENKSAETNKSGNKKKSSTRAIEESINGLLALKPPGKNIYDYLLEELPEELLLAAMEASRKAAKSPARILGAPGRPHYSLKPNPFTPDELRDINDRLIQSYKRGM